MIYLETKHLILRDYREEDFLGYYRLKADPKTMYYLQDVQLFTKEEAYEDFRMVLEDMQKSDRKFYFMHIELKDSHECGCPRDKIRSISNGHLWNTKNEKIPQTEF